MKIECSSLSKNFGSVKALDSVDLTLEGCKIIGLVGRNGAGKTSLLKCLAGALIPTEGSVFIEDEAPFDNAYIQSRMAFSRDQLVFDDGLKVKEIFSIASCYYPKWDGEAADSLCQNFGVDTNKKIGKLSKGLKTSLSIILAMASNAELTLFDEPTDGLDAAHRNLFYKLLIQESEKEERLFVLSSHLLSEIDRLLEEIVLIDSGKILLHDSMDRFRESFIELEGHRDKISLIEEQMKRIHNRFEIGEKIRITVESEEFEILPENMKEGIRLSNPSPQDLCIALTEKEYAL